MSENVSRLEKNTFSGWEYSPAGCSARYLPRSNRATAARERVPLLPLWLRIGSRTRAADPYNPTRTVRCAAKNIAPSRAWDLRRGDASDQRIPFVFCEHLLECDCFQFVRHRHRIVRLVPDSARTRFGIDFNNQIQVVIFRRPFAELEHFWKLVSRVDVQHRKRDAAEKRLARQPDENIGIFAHRPRHGDILEGVIRLAKNKNALVLELVEMGAAQFRHVMVLL